MSYSYLGAITPIPEEGRLSSLDAEYCKAAAKENQGVYAACVHDKLSREKTHSTVAIIGGVLVVGILIWRFGKR